MTLDLAELKSVLIAVLTAALLFLGAAYWRKSGQQDKADEAEELRKRSVSDRLQELEANMRMLGIAVQPITAAMAAVLVKSLTHFHTPETDALLAKVGPPNVLTAIEEAHLVELLANRTRDMGSEFSDSERNAAKLLPLIIERTRIEDREGQQTYLALVGIPKEHE
jgi:H+/gluconate symporter-like permease